MIHINGSSQICRIDIFIVPSRARGEFLENVYKMQSFLRTLPGFAQDLVLEQVDGSSEFNVVTIVVWEDAKSIENAKQSVIARNKEIGFNPQTLYEKLGIKAVRGDYQQNVL